MSFDLKLTDGDISFGADGSFEVVSGINKLQQDISKILLTPIGSDIASRQYGSSLPDVQGKTWGISQDITKSLVAKSVAEAMQFLKTAEVVQSVKQELTYDEVLSDIEAVAVTIENKRININMSILTAQGNRTIFAVL